MFIAVLWLMSLMYVGLGVNERSAATDILVNILTAFIKMIQAINLGFQNSLHLMGLRIIWMFGTGALWEETSGLGYMLAHPWFICEISEFKKSCVTHSVIYKESYITCIKNRLIKKSNMSEEHFAIKTNIMRQPIINQSNQLRHYMNCLGIDSANIHSHKKRI